MTTIINSIKGFFSSNNQSNSQANYVNIDSPLFTPQDINKIQSFVNSEASDVKMLNLFNDILRLQNSFTIQKNRYTEYKNSDNFNNGLQPIGPTLSKLEQSIETKENMIKDTWNEISDKLDLYENNSIPLFTKLEIRNSLIELKANFTSLNTEIDLSGSKIVKIINRNDPHAPKIVWSMLESHSLNEFYLLHLSVVALAISLVLLSIIYIIYKKKENIKVFFILNINWLIPFIILIWSVVLRIVLNDS